MTEFGAPMFLVRVERGRKPRVYRLDPHEALTVLADKTGAHTRRRQPRAWWIRASLRVTSKVIGAAAVANSVEEAHQLIGRLKGEPEEEAG